MLSALTGYLLLRFHRLFFLLPSSSCSFSGFTGTRQGGGYRLFLRITLTPHLAYVLANRLFTATFG
jgi:hypothetical protein